METFLLAALFVMASFLIFVLGASVWWRAMGELTLPVPSAFTVLTLLASAVMLAWIAYAVSVAVWITLLFVYVALTCVRIYELS